MSRPSIPRDMTDSDLAILIVQLDGRGDDCAARLKNVGKLLKEKIK